MRAEIFHDPITPVGGTTTSFLELTDVTEDEYEDWTGNFPVLRVTVSGSETFTTYIPNASVKWITFLDP